MSIPIVQPNEPLNKLDSVTFDQMLEQQYPFGKQDPLIDLGDIRLISPAGLVQLASLCFALVEEGLNPTILVQDSLVRSYLRCSGFLSVIDGIAGIKPPLSQTTSQGYEIMRGSNPMLIEVTKVKTSSELPDLLDRIIWVLRYRLKYRKHETFDIATAASEILQNTFDHNKSACGFVAMQVYGHGRDSFLELGVADYGDGLAVTLARNPKNNPIVSDIEAIKKAIEPGTSEYPDPTRGTGLYHLLEIAYKHEGSVQIRSGGAKARFRMDKRKGWGFHVPKMPGVQISINLPAKIKSGP